MKNKLVMKSRKIKVVMISFLFICLVIILYFFGGFNSAIAKVVHLKDLKSTLKDPESLIVEEHIIYEPDHENDIVISYKKNGTSIICSKIKYNAKNSFGGYTGMQESISGIEYSSLYGFAYDFVSVRSEMLIDVWSTSNYMPLLEKSLACLSYGE